MFENAFKWLFMALSNYIFWKQILSDMVYYTYGPKLLKLHDIKMAWQESASSSRITQFMNKNLVSIWSSDTYIVLV